MRASTLIKLARAGSMFFSPQAPPTAFARNDRSLLLETTAETSANISFGNLGQDGTLDLVLAKGRHGPGTFRSAIQRLGIDRDWYQYRDAAFEAFAKQWQCDNAIEYDS